MAKRQPFSFEQLYNTLVGGFAPLGKGPLGQRASIETQLQYGPTLQALVQLGQQTQSQHRQNVRGIRRGGFGAAQSIGQVAQDFQGLLGATPAPTSEAAGKLGLTREAVGGALARMQAQQYAGVNSGVQRARGQFRQGRQDIVGQMLQAAQKGALYNQGQYSGYASDRAKQREAQTQWETEQRLGLIKQGINPDTMRFDPRLSAPKAASINQYGYSDRQWAAMSPADRRSAAKQWNTDTKAPSSSGGSGPNAMTPAQRRARRENYAEVRDDIEGIKNYWQSLAKTKVYTDKDGKQSLTPIQDPAKVEALPEDLIVSRIQKKYGDKVPPVVIKAALQLNEGFLTTGTIAALKKRYPKIQIPREWHPPRGYGVLAP